jgi:Ca-activated chloride channel family protein
MYIEFLLAKAQQEKALAYGFRPADPAVAVTSPIAAAFGADPAEPKTTLEVPSAEVMDAVLKTWRINKKAANVVLVLDTSGSMTAENKMAHAKAGAEQLLERLDDADLLSLLPFNDKSRWAGQGMAMSSSREASLRTVQGLIAAGGTRLYDSIDVAVKYLNDNPTPGKIAAVVVLTDGQDTDSALKLEPLIERIKSDGERNSVRVFTIGYGSGADEKILKRIADSTQGKFYKGTPQNLREVFRDIATFF